MTLRKLLPALCIVSLLAFSLAQHGEETESASNEAESTKSVSPCARPLEELYHSIEEIFGENYTVYINCLSFDAKGALRLGVASGQNPEGSSSRYILECRGDILVATPDGLPVDTTDIRDTSCVECNTSLTSGSCTEMCAGQCERCYESTSSCTRCTACVSDESEGCTYEGIKSNSATCRTECGDASTINHELYNHCECVPPGYLILDNYRPHPGEEEIECHGPLEPLRGTCVLDCRAAGMNRMAGLVLDPNNETGACWPCGIPHCARCNGVINECLVCVEESVLYEHECITCPNAPIAVEAIEQEEEIHLEEEKQQERTIILGTVLPIVSVLIIVFFVSMSIFAHHRYPHVGYHGHKRHRKPPEERSPSPTINGDDQEALQPPQLHHVWRPRPTIVLR